MSSTLILQATTFQFVINLQTPRTFDIEVPPDAARHSRRGYGVSHLRCSSGAWSLYRDLLAKCSYAGPGGEATSAVAVARGPC